MIRRKTAPRTKAGIETAVAAAAFRLLASRPWREVTIASVARAAKLPLADVLSHAPSRTDLVAMMLHGMAAETARRYRPEPRQQSVRERLFDVVMTWFEVQKPRKKAVRNLFRALGKDPLIVLSLRGEILRGSQMLLALAEADGGRVPSFRAVSLAAVIARAVPVWLEEEGEPDRTMAQVDRDLRRLERLL
ncbi:MAG: TetR/AcrR family transcriptional regulator [Rhizomicrobium sp.]